MNAKFQFLNWPKNDSSEEKLVTSIVYTAKQNCLQADRLEINILVHKIIF